MDFLKLQPIQHHRLTRSTQDRIEARYWRDFKTPVFIKSYAPISHITFSSKSPHRYSVASGTKLQIYSPKTLNVVKTISRFQLPVRFSDIKSDGKLIVASDDSGLIQVFDLNSRAILRSFNDIKQPVHCVRFSPASNKVLACSDDSTVRLYDLATSQILNTFVGHQDYVRTGAFTNSNLILSASYDGSIKLWDHRINQNHSSVWSANHRHPIENILIHPSNTLAISAGGPTLKIWDILGSSQHNQPLLNISNHQKTITSLAWARGPSNQIDQANHSTRRLLSAGLDGLVKVYDLSTGSYKVRHTIRYSSPILSMDLSPDDNLLIVGCTDGSLSMRKRIKSSKNPIKKSSNLKSLSSSNQLTNSSSTLGTEIIWSKQETLMMEEIALAGTLDNQDLHQSQLQPENSINLLSSLPHPTTTTPQVEVLKQKRKQRLQTWDKMLKAFRYGDALDSVISPTIPPNITFSLIRELIRRDGLHQALSGRDEISLVPILHLISKHITDPRWFNITSAVLKSIMELYQPVLGKSRTVDSLLSTIFHRISDEVRLHSTLFEVNAQLEMILSSFD
ncbi:hypothetical protein O181_024557 [Austropuccinia psidii MF-1]|uniref:U3 small nucleolar RNA-associated protein 15 C-terminal domain-containing protein n=1 Tax=Austropuccinia psidii MF-1 TaxID=1389203 RepID=A0A9Q3GZ30_9BASI|nr:hypothetical protein [Austropuccinia psidii MF-1]